LIHRSEVVVIEGDSYRQKEAKEKLDAREKLRKEKGANQPATKGAKSENRNSKKVPVRGGAR
ncbi:MAG: hypothetical protein K8F91_11065, partial [Candidatus Obscuribacterales bacterium]|nr:hypothetical protein [Candidatus Obscuribacterales bacterium]